MPTNVHSRLPSEEIHRPFRQIFADISALSSDATVYTSDDLHKIGYVESNNKIYILTSISPIVWSEVTGGTGSGGGIKFAKFALATSLEKIEATTTSPVAFATKFTIPANLISAGDLVSFSALINSYNNTGSPVNYDVGIAFGGVIQNLYTVSSAGTSDNLVVIGPGGSTGSFITAGSSASFTSFGLIRDSSNFEFFGFTPFTFDSTVNFDFELYITWSSTAAPADLYAQFITLDLKIISST